jgi:hypothetical protein
VQFAQVNRRQFAEGLQTFQRVVVGDGWPEYGLPEKKDADGERQVEALTDQSGRRRW